uniref:hypothetical protein n=1 Tax=Agrobacterium sp. ST15.13.040 TaxID=3017318 RepID=UPI0022EC3287
KLSKIEFREGARHEKSRCDFPKSLEPLCSGKMGNKNLAKVLGIISAEKIFRTPLSEHAREKGKARISQKYTPKQKQR